MFGVASGFLRDYTLECVFTNAEEDVCLKPDLMRDRGVKKQLR